jgi:hypothetical protein
MVESIIVFYKMLYRKIFSPEDNLTFENVKQSHDPKTEYQLEVQKITLKMAE